MSAGQIRLEPSCSGRLSLPDVPGNVGHVPLQARLATRESETEDAFSLSRASGGGS